MLFPAATDFVASSVALTPAQRKAISRTARVPAPKTLNAWRAMRGDVHLGWFLLDQVLGKHEYITYAVALDPSGLVRGVEILEYRETYGGEIRNPLWRRQFAGKGAGSALDLGRDIKNISGATLSSKHVTEGIRKLLASYALVLARG